MAQARDLSSHDQSCGDSVATLSARIAEETVHVSPSSPHDMKKEKIRIKLATGMRQHEGRADKS